MHKVVLSHDKRVIVGEIKADPPGVKNLRFSLILLQKMKKHFTDVERIDDANQVYKTLAQYVYLVPTVESRAVKQIAKNLYLNMADKYENLDETELYIRTLCVLIQEILRKVDGR